MRIALGSTTRRLLFGCCVLLAIAEFVYLSSRAVRAHAWAAGAQKWQIERAVALEPRNSDYWYRLGNWHLLIDQDSVSALNAYNAAVRQNPHIAAYYLAIARVALFANDRTQLAGALENALRVDPTTPSVNWDAANLYLAANEVARALPLFRTASAASWEYRLPGISLCWQATHDVDRMVAVALPRNKEIYGDFLRYLVVRRETAAADKMWSHLVALHEASAPKVGFLYLDSLLEQHRVADAARAWQELAIISPEVSSHLPQDGNLVINSGFEQEILNGGFDWRISPPDSVAVEETAEEFYKGEHSLAVSFATSTTGNAGVLQLIPVEPGASYSLSLAYKAEELEGAHGISVVVSDASTGKPLTATDEILGSNPWREISRSFCTDPSTALVSLELKRPAGTLIRGKILIDDVRMVKQ
jgi:tetratricopeptide (TPR) repeat protein